MDHFYTIKEKCLYSRKRHLTGRGRSFKTSSLVGGRTGWPWLARGRPGAESSLQEGLRQQRVSVKEPPERESRRRFSRFGRRGRVFAVARIDPRHVGCRHRHRRRRRRFTSARQRLVPRKFAGGIRNFALIVRFDGRNFRFAATAEEPKSCTPATFVPGDFTRGRVNFDDNVVVVLDVFFRRSCIVFLRRHRR